MYPAGAMLNMDIYKHYDDRYVLNDCEFTLKNANLWEEFHEMETEMIITKSGRRMFPSLHVQLANMDPKQLYTIHLEMVPLAHCRFKYSNSGGWAPAGTEEAQSPQRIYVHPDSPADGEFWMSQPVSFGRMKLTNTLAPPPGHVVLSSMHKYQPVVVVSKTADARCIPWAPSVRKAFPETQFIAVTAYQNEKITKLKIDNNPFAKGFRETGQAKCKRKRTGDEDKQSAKRPKEEGLSPLRLEDSSKSFSSSMSSPPSSPEITQLHPSNGPETSQCTNYVPTTYPIMCSPCYYPYPYYSSPMWSVGWSAAMYHSVKSYSPPQTLKNFVVDEKPVEEVPRKFTDFSIKAITGSS